jgi:colanic acid/amylovoran biosynthesis glycosyltransferase
VQNVKSDESFGRVVIFRADLLPISETFILSQANALRRFQPVFAGLRRVKPSLKIPGSAMVAAEGRSLFRRYAPDLYKTMGPGPRFLRRVQALGARLIHAHFAIDGVLALPLAQKLGLPLIVTLHGYDVTVADSEFAKYRTGRLYLRRRTRLWNQAALFLCDSDFLRLKAIEAGFPEAKLRTHHIGVDPRAFSRAEQAPDKASVLFVGRLVEKKGCDLLIRAMFKVQQQVSGAQLIIIGDGPLRASLEQLAKDLNVNCVFLGSRSSEQIKQALQRASIFCAPSRTAKNGDSEALGIVFLEAQAMGVPVVSSLHGGIPEAVIHGKTGLLAPEGDYHFLAEHLQSLLQREDLRFLYGSRGMEWVRESFDIQARTKALEDAYEEVVSAAAEQRSTVLRRTDNTLGILSQPVENK